jgi:hypothetical protein
VEALTLRDDGVPDLLVVVRLGSITLRYDRLAKSVAESHDRWGIWGFSVLEIPHGDYALLARLRPNFTTRRLLLVAHGADVVAAGFSLLPTLEHPHWTVVLPEATSHQFEAVRRLFRGPIPNPAWTATH